MNLPNIRGLFAPGAPGAAPQADSPPDKWFGAIRRLTLLTERGELRWLSAASGGYYASFAGFRLWLEASDFGPCLLTLTQGGVSLKFPAPAAALAEAVHEQAVRSVGLDEFLAALDRATADKGTE